MTSGLLGLQPTTETTTAFSGMTRARSGLPDFRVCTDGVPWSSGWVLLICHAAMISTAHARISLFLPDWFEGDGHSRFATTATQD